MKRTAIRHLWPLLALLVWGAPAAAQTSAAALRIDPPTLSLIAGQTQTIAIVIQDAAEVYGIDVRASFDPALVEVVDANPARDGVQMTAGVFPQPDFVALNAADNAAGALRYVVTQVNPTQPATGGGVVFTFQVRGRANGVSPLRVDLVEMANRSGELLPVTTTDGTVTVTGGQPPPTGVALTVPAEGGQPAVTASAATVAPAPTVAPETPRPPPRPQPCQRPPPQRRPTRPSARPPHRQRRDQRRRRHRSRRHASVETDAVAVAATPPAEPSRRRRPDGHQRRRGPNGRRRGAVGDGADESNAPPVIGAGTDASGRDARPRRPTTRPAARCCSA